MKQQFQEIERKFLLTKPPLDIDRYPHKQIDQGYLAITPDHTTVRVRRLADTYYLTIKGDGNIARTEVELEITQAQFKALWSLTTGKRLEKVRYYIPLDNHKIELDIYEGALRGLVTAEIEFNSKAEAQSFQPPNFFDKEITMDNRYKNSSLATYGKPKE
jgi:adenylate cyclase